MPKTATIGVRIDENLKNQAQEALDAMGLPMSLAIELFLRQVAETGKLPFALGQDLGADAEAKARQRDFWKAFMLWYFKCWPMFDAPACAREARERFGFEGVSAGSVVREFIERAAVDGDAPDSQRLAALDDLNRVLALLGDAKELVYWALGMDKVFAPELSWTYADKVDAWRMAYLRAQTKPERERDERISADAVIGKRFFGEDEAPEEA